MSRIAKGGKGLIGLGAAILAAGYVGAVPGSPDAAFGLLVVGVLLVAVSRVDLSFVGVQTQLGMDRQDIVASTDWSRIGKYTFRKSFGGAIAASGLLLFVLSLGLQEFTLAATWAAVALAGLVLVAVSWRYAHEIAADHTHTVSVRVPDMFSIHSFHVALRQRAEDLGYRIIADGSPTKSGSASAVDDEIFHSKGGFKARKRPIGESRRLLPGVDDPYAERLLTVTTVGVFATFLGVMTLSVGGELTANGELLGLPLLLIGIVVVGYDYVTRTREWGELYCIEEGTVYASRINKYEDRVLNAVERGAEPTISSPATGATLSVTVGAKCTSLYDEDELESDFDELVGTVESAAENHQFSVVGAGDGSTVLTHTEPATSN
ncbi:hypothetical protein [Halovivax sp.]|uniref:hypothetical protein n=1 Tax=Halovivax sp. TaxID=1935978 RepID=UPI0025C59098|nr:hypothetical protein [Halovivax sp.]